MSTHAMIAITNREGTSNKAIYLHFDGGPDRAGITLRNYYRYEDKVNALMVGGDLDVLSPDGDLDKNQIFDNDCEIFPPVSRGVQLGLAYARSDCRHLYIYDREKEDWLHVTKAGVISTIPERLAEEQRLNAL